MAAARTKAPPAAKRHQGLLHSQAIYFVEESVSSLFETRVSSRLISRSCVRVATPADSSSRFCHRSSEILPEGWRRCAKADSSLPRVLPRAESFFQLFSAWPRRAVTFLSASVH